MSPFSVNEKDMSLTEALNIYYYRPLLNAVVKSHVDFYKAVLYNCDFDAVKDNIKDNKRLKKELRSR
ncbi:MAG: hypothetical protein GY861_28275 [bacterium]|nr:hypothetical protein [bacterium]